jgi:hypothetical protein
MRKIRNAVIDKDWSGLQKIAADNSIHQTLSKLPGASLELTLALREAHNSNVVNNLEKVLRASGAGEDPNQENLQRVIASAEADEITDYPTKQLLECAK